jgi:2-methylcitrate dehydratase PrpD
MDLTVTEAMAEAFVAFGDATLNPELQHKAKLCLKDYLAAALTSTGRPWVEQALAVAALDSSTEAGIIGSATRASAETAAFANAVAGHGLVRDDMHLGSISHLGVVVLPAVLAWSETIPISGSALLSAIVIGYEAGGRLGRAVMDSAIARIHRPTGTVGPFAAAAALASLARLDQQRFAAALGLATNLAAGYNEWAAAGGTEMFFHPGFAARDALLAVRLAASGATISATALEGQAGMLAAFGKSWPEDLAIPFAARAEILDVFFKEVPACNYAQTAAQAARDLAADDPLTAASIRDVCVRVPQAAAAYPGCNVGGPIATSLQAKMSIQYNVAAALLTGNFEESNYQPETQPEICRLAARISLTVDDELTRGYPARQGAEVAVNTSDGRRLLRKLKNVEPASEETVAERFQRAADRRLGPDRAARLRTAIDSLETLADSSQIIAGCTV